jgi:hypothetical protein
MSQTMVAAPLDAHAAKSRRIRSRRKLLVPAAALVIAAAVAVPVAISESGHPAQPARVGSPAGEATYNGLTLRFPASWHAVLPTFITAAIPSPLGWITNAKPGPECTTSCHGPVTHLSSGVVQIALVAQGGSIDFTKSLVINSQIAGLPAQRIDSTNGCDRSAVSGFSVIAAETRTSVVRLTACFGPNTSAQQRQVQDMLNSASYRHK